MTIGSRIEMLRKTNSLTRKQLGEHVGMHPQTLYRYEAGARGIDAESVGKIANFFSVSTDWIISGQESPKEETHHKEITNLDAKDSKETTLLLENALLKKLLAAQEDALLAREDTVQAYKKMLQLIQTDEEIKKGLNISNTPQQSTTDAKKSALAVHFAGQFNEI